MGSTHDQSRSISGSLLDPRIIDPRQELVSYDDIDPDDLEQIIEVLNALRDWRDAEQRMSERSQRYMKLNRNDMQALRFIIAMHNQGILATPGALADHLRISTASTTKLLDRLERAGHIERAPHPTDRRALIISVTDDTHKEVRRTVGTTHARRFAAAAALTPDERGAVIRFLTALSETDRPAAP